MNSHDKLIAWKQKFYPVNADDLKEESDEACLKHSILKWTGALEENLGKRLEYFNNSIFDGKDYFDFDDKSCALCSKYNYECKNEEKIECPIIRVTGFSCCVNPDHTFYSSANDPTPMINLLKLVLNHIETSS